MQDLYEASHEVIHLGIRVELKVFYIERISGHRSSSVATQVATTKPLYCTALGKVMLAYSPSELVEEVIAAGLQPRTGATRVAPELFREELQEIARAGVAYDNEEFDVGLKCVAAPILSEEHAVAAISVASRRAAFEPARLARSVRSAAEAISRSLSDPASGSSAQLARTSHHATRADGLGSGKIGTDG